MSHPLKKQCMDNVIEYWSLLAKSAGGFIINNDFMTATIAGINSGIFNAILKFDINHYGKIKEKIASQFNNKLLPIAFFQDDSAPLQEKKFFEESKFVSFGHVPMMVINTKKSFPAPIPKNVKIIKLENQDLTAWMKPFSISFEFDAEISNQLKPIFEENSDKLTHLAAIHNDEVIGCASVYTRGEFAGFYNLGVLPEYRNKGIASVLHLARLEYAKNSGFEYATLQATPMATKLDTELGFEKVGGFDIYMDSVNG